MTVQNEYLEHKIRVLTEFFKRFELSKDIDYDIFKKNIPMCLKEYYIRQYFRDLDNICRNQAIDLFKTDEQRFEEMYQIAYESIETDRLV